MCICLIPNFPCYQLRTLKLNKSHPDYLSMDKAWWTVLSLRETRGVAVSNIVSESKAVYAMFAFATMLVASYQVSDI